MDLREAADQDLAEQYYVCDNAAYTELYARYFPRLVAWFGLHIQQTDACDLAHQTLVKFLLTKHNEASRFDGRRGKFPPWIFRIAGNLFIDYLRKPREVTFSELEEAGVQSPVIERISEARLCVEDQLIRQAFCEAVKRCIRELDPVLAYVVLERAAGLTLAEIAARLKLSPATVARHERKAARQLKDCLERHGYAVIPKGAQQAGEDVIAEMESEVIVRLRGALKEIRDECGELA